MYTPNLTPPPQTDSQTKPAVLHPIGYFVDHTLPLTCGEMQVAPQAVGAALALDAARLYLATQGAKVAGEALAAAFSLSRGGCGGGGGARE